MEARHPSFFIFGPERSGTTLLTFLLSGQPNIFVLNDSFVFDRYVEWALLGSPDKNESRVRRTGRLGLKLLPYLIQGRGFDQWSTRLIYYSARSRFASQLDPSETVSAEDAGAYYATLRARYESSLRRATPSFLNSYAKGIVDAPTDVTVRELISEAIWSVGQLFEDLHHVIIGEKTPLHTPYADWIKAVYPSAKLILMVRDPVANVASIVKRYGDFRRAVGTYALYADCLLRMSSDPDVLVVTHEELTGSTPATLGRILAFLNPQLELDETCPVNAYTKSDYTGVAVDSTRVSMTPDILNGRQVKYVAARFSAINREFYA